MKHLTSLISLALAAGPALVSAAPSRFYGKRAASDVTVLKFADVLEQLENNFYSQALSKFQDSDFTSAGFSSSSVPIEQFKIIQSDESTHSSVLQSALKSFGETPITSCKFNFDSVLTDVATMAATARVVENVGVAAYLGGATLVTDPIVLSAAGSILTVEARHQTLLNILSGSGTAIPAAFDMALQPNEVLAIAAPFFDGACDLGIPANPTLTITNTGSVGPGTLLTFNSPALNGTVSKDGMFCQMMLGGAPTSIPLPLSQCVVPDGINGPVGIWITSDGQPLINNVRDRASSQLVAGPTLAFIDTQPQSLGQLTRSSGSAPPSNSGSSGSSGGSGSSGSSGSNTDTATASTSTSTTTISPADASSIIASASVASGIAVPSGTGSAAAAAPTVNNPAANTTPGEPNQFAGPSPDGKTTVLGWMNLPQ
ncbi:hypothetical protein AN958_04102 [Leucoagaricus sp. SymC.cos]|nr:hypothetical protein AN958_04102 [Leucoagaricus sp. SymC.cos]